MSARHGQGCGQWSWQWQWKWYWYWYWYGGVPPPLSDVLERPYTVGGGGVPPPGPPPLQCLRLTAKILLRRQEDSR